VCKSTGLRSRSGTHFSLAIVLSSLYMTPFPSTKKWLRCPDCLALCFSPQLPLHSFQLPPALPHSLTHPLTHSCSLTHTLLQVDPTTDSAVLDLNTNYNYSLTLVVGASSVQLKASSRFAVAHGLETLAQLYSPGNPPFGAFSVSDGPQFRCIFHQPSYSLHSTPLHSTPLHSTPLHSTPLHSTTVNTEHCTALCSTPLHSTPLHFTSLHLARPVPLHFTPLH
jgi:hypothetical protein